jgi:hypothetical protein
MGAHERDVQATPSFRRAAVRAQPLRQARGKLARDLGIPISSWVQAMATIRKFFPPNGKREVLSTRVRQGQ